MSTATAIRVAGLEKSFKDVHVLRGVDFDVARGSIFAQSASRRASAFATSAGFAPGARPGSATKNENDAPATASRMPAATATGAAADSMPRPAAARKRPPRSRGRRRKSSRRCARCVPT